MRSFRISLIASRVRKRATRPARPSSSPSSPRSRICRPGSAPPSCFPMSWGGRRSRRRDCWADRPRRSTAPCSGPAQPSPRDTRRDVLRVDQSPTPKKACCSNVTCRLGRPPISTAWSSSCARTPPIACRPGWSGMKDARRSGVSSRRSGTILRASARWPSAPTPSRRSGSMHAAGRTLCGEPIPCT